MFLEKFLKSSCVEKRKDWWNQYKRNKYQQKNPCKD